MISLDFQATDFKIRREGQRQFIFDFIRKKYVVLTPEEWVRQHILVYLCSIMAYPKGLISVEKEIKINQLRKRYDIVVYDYDHQPWMLVECKASDVHIADMVLQQLLRYHNVLQCPYWMLSNGRQTFCAASGGLEVEWLHSLPTHNV